MHKLDINILVAGLTRDSEKTLASEIKQISLALQGYKEVYWLIVESDSTDNTINVLDDLKDSIDNFEYAALGMLSNDYPVRSPRVSACRNHYINEINSNVSIYPNPANNSFKVKSKNKIQQLTIYNIIGESVIDVYPQQKEFWLDVSFLSSNLYTVKLITDNDQKIEKLLIHH